MQRGVERLDLYNSARAQQWPSPVTGRVWLSHWVLSCGTGRESRPGISQGPLQAFAVPPLLPFGEICRFLCQ